MNDDLPAFLAARLDETAAIATAAADGTIGLWVIDTDGNVQNEDTRGGGSAYVACGPWSGGVDEDHARHIVLNGPARVLREVAAKRAIAGLHVPLDGIEPQQCIICLEYEPCRTLRHLAAVWSDHPGYRQEWKP